MRLSTAQSEQYFEVAWLDPGLVGFVDLLPAATFWQEQPTTSFEHKIRIPSGPGMKAKCSIRQDGDEFYLDYEQFSEANKQWDVLLGVLRLNFADTDRTSIKSVEWKDNGSDRFVDANVKVSLTPPLREPSYHGPGEESKRVQRLIRERPQQVAFRRKLKSIYQSCCCISGCRIPEVLEGAHIDAYTGPDSDHVQNGLLLRCDLHALFDKNLMGIEPGTRKVWFAPEVRAWDEYGNMHRQKQVMPRTAEHYAPCPAAIQRRWVKYCKTDPEAASVTQTFASE